jgi:ABC-type dipeptide/oligopeptide/nickel transport system permease subunit
MNERVTRALRRDARAWFGIGVVAVIVLLAVLAPLVSHHDPLAIDLVNQLQGPSPAHWLGTDIQGRDVWARLVYGSRVSLTAGIVSQAIALLLGLSLGLVAGYKGGWVDELVMRLADVTLAFPTLLLLIAMAAALQPSLTVVFFTIGVVGWAGMARLVRGQVLVVRQLEFVQASRALGARDVRVVLQHVLPNVVLPRGDHGRIVAVVPRPWRAAPDAELGVDDRRWPRPQSAAQRAVDVGGAWIRHRRGGARLQPPRRRAA